MPGPGQQHRPPATDAGGAESTVMSAAPVAEPHLAPGGGNSVMLGAIGGMDSGLRQLPDGGSAYGHDGAQDGLLGTGVRSLDRLMAQAELASRFNVVEDDFVGPRLPNQVTRSEFERIATLYSDIRMGDTNLQFDTGGMSEADATAFRNGAMNDLADILTTEQGRGLLDDLAYEEVDGRDLTTTIGRAATPGDAGAYMAAGQDPAHATDGTGVSGGVNYIPGRTLDMAVDLQNPNYETSPWRNMTSDIVLFHELVHANRSRLGITEGSWDPVAGQFDRPAIEDREARSRYDRGAAIEEYATVGLAGYGDGYTENQYRAERALATGTAIPQRDTYNGSGPARRNRRR